MSRFIPWQLESKPASTIPKLDPENDGEEEAVKLQDKTLEGRLGADPFIATEVDVAKCNALSTAPKQLRIFQF